MKTVEDWGGDPLVEKVVGICEVTWNSFSIITMSERIKKELQILIVNSLFNCRVLQPSEIYKELTLSSEYKKWRELSFNDRLIFHIIGGIIRSVIEG